MVHYEASRSHIVIPVITQKGVIKMAPTKPKKVTNIVEKSSCQGVKFTSRINSSNFAVQNKQQNSTIYSKKQDAAQPVITCSKLTIQILERGV